MADAKKFSPLLKFFMRLKMLGWNEEEDMSKHTKKDEKHPAKHTPPAHLPEPHRGGLPHLETPQSQDIPQAGPLVSDGEGDAPVPSVFGVGRSSHVVVPDAEPGTLSRSLPHPDALAEFIANPTPAHLNVNGTEAPKSDAALVIEQIDAIVAPKTFQKCEPCKGTGIRPEGSTLPNCPHCNGGGQVLR